MKRSILQTHLDTIQYKSRLITISILISYCIGFTIAYTLVTMIPLLIVFPIIWAIRLSSNPIMKLVNYSFGIPFKIVSFIVITFCFIMLQTFIPYTISTYLSDYVVYAQYLLYYVVLVVCFPTMIYVNENEK